MLDKLSEKVLQYAISQRKDYLENISFNEVDAAILGVDFARLRVVCEYLQKKEYLTIVCSYYDNDIRITLTHKGFSYFEYKHICLKEVLLNGVLLPVITALITTLITNYISTIL